MSSKTSWTGRFKVLDVEVKGKTGGVYERPEVVVTLEQTGVFTPGKLKSSTEVPK